MTNNKEPNREAQWKKWTQYVFTEFGKCEVDGTRITNRTRTFNNAFIIELRCTYQVYRECVAAIVEAYEGHCPSFTSNDNPKTLGREYDYILVFTKDPLDAEFFYIDRQGQLRDRRGED